MNIALFAAGTYRISLDGWPDHIPWLFLLMLLVTNLNGISAIRRMKRKNISPVL